MNNAVMIAVAPLAVGLLVYVFQVFGYQFILHRPGMALAFFGYVLANAGLIWDAVNVGVVK